MDTPTHNYILIGLIVALFLYIYYGPEHFGNCKEYNHLSQNEIDNYNNRNFNVNGTDKYYTTLQLDKIKKPTCCKKHLGYPVIEDNRLSCNCPKDDESSNKYN